MLTLLPEKKGTFLRASLCDVCNFSCEYCAKDMGMENHTPKCIEAGLLSAEEYDRNMETIRKYVDVLKISVDAVDDDLRVKITHCPEAKDTLHVVEECCKAGIMQIGLNFVYMKQNAAELPKLIAFVKRLNKEYNGNIYISVLDLYYSKENDDFWREQFVNLKELRQSLAERDIEVHRRMRIGCDSYYCIWDGVRVNMKDSMSCTHRSEICRDCTGYCQEGIYSLKHSASGWLSVCPSNDAKLGALLRDDDAESTIDRFVDILNHITRVPDTGLDFMKKNGLCDVPYMKKTKVKECLELRNEIKKRARQYCEEHGFMEFDTPVLTMYAGEPYNPTFSVLSEGETVHLADSPQVYKMLLMLSGYERYYQFAHCFRPIAHEDASETHLREFIQLDIEMQVDSLNELMDTARELLQHVCKDAAPELIPYLPLTTGKQGVHGKIMPEHHIFAKPVDLRIDREQNIFEPSDLLAVKTESFDILLNGIEVGGGDMRIMDVSMQESMMELFGVDEKVYKGYLQELGRYRGRPFDGFAIGLERLVMAMTEVSDIRETIAFDTWQ